MSESPNRSEQYADDDFDDVEDGFEPEDIPGIRKSLTFYRILAYVVGVLLIVLTLIAMPLKYIWGNDALVYYVGVSHGWLYALLLISVVNLGLKVKWRWVWYLGIALAGTVPFLSFVAEHRATKYVRARIAEVEAEYGVSE